MGIRDFLREGALALGLAGIISSCSSFEPYKQTKEEWKFKSSKVIKIEKSEEVLSEYQFTRASLMPDKEYSKFLEIIVDKQLNITHYEKETEEVTREKHIETWLITGEATGKKTRFGPGSYYEPKGLIDSSPTGETKREIFEKGPKKIRDSIRKERANSIPIEVYATPRKLIKSSEALIFNGQGSSLETKTGEDGVLKVEVKISQDENNIFLDKEDIKKADWKNIKEPAKSFIAKYLFNHAKSETNEYQISIRTRVQDAKNDGKDIDFTINRWVVADSLLEEAVKQFVEEEFNSKIKKANITLLDYESHTPITLTKDSGESYKEANIVLEPTNKVPSKEDLMEPYFKGKYLQTALATLHDYITTKREISADTERGEASFYVYPPSDFKVKITHTKYHHVSDEIIGFSKDSLDKEVYMSKIGKKVDLKIVDKEPKSKIKDKE